MDAHYLAVGKAYGHQTPRGTTSVFVRYQAGEGDPGDPSTDHEGENGGVQVEGGGALQGRGVPHTKGAIQAARVQDGGKDGVMMKGGDIAAVTHHVSEHAEDATAGG